MAKRVSMTKEERGQLVLRLLRNEATAAELARECSIPEPTLYRWLNTFLEAGCTSLENPWGTKNVALMIINFGIFWLAMVLLLVQLFGIHHWIPQAFAGLLIPFFPALFVFLYWLRRKREKQDDEKIQR